MRINLDHQVYELTGTDLRELNRCVRRHDDDIAWANRADMSVPILVPEPPRRTPDLVDLLRLQQSAAGDKCACS